MHALQTLRRAARALGRRPLWSLSVVALLALGLGANLAIFTVLEAVVLQPPPFPAGDRLVMVWETQEANATRPVAPANFLDWRVQRRAFEGLAALRFGRLAWTGDGPPQALAAGFASGNLFSLLGVSPAVGRLFDLADEQDAERLVVLSDGLWRQRFGGRADAVGRTMTLGDEPYRVVGVLPPGFSLLRRAEVWTVGARGVPGGAPVGGGAPPRDAHYLRVLGRLRNGTTLATARAEMSTVAAGLAARYPQTNAGLGAHVTTLQETLAGSAPPVLFAIQAGALLLLLVALANVGTLLLARASERAREVAMRQALGAGRGALLAEAAAEAGLLAAAGAAAAFGAAFLGVRWLVHLAPAALPRLDEIRLGAPALVAIAGLAALATLVCTLAPLALRTAPALLLRATAGAGGSAGAARGRSTLTVVQLALAQVLLLGAALLGSSLARLRAVDTGIRPEGMLVASLDLSAARSGDPDARRRFYDAALARLRRVPGVREAELALSAPLAGSIDRGFWIDGRAESGPNQVDVVGFQTVSAGYFHALGVPLLGGRAFADADAAGPRVAIVNRALAERYFPGEDPLGKRLGVGRRGDPQELRTIVGLCGDVRDDGLAEPAGPMLYVPYAQNREPWNFASLLLRVEGDPARAAEGVRRAVLEVDPDQPLTRIQPLVEAVAEELAPRRFSALLAGLFAATALAIAALGTWALVAFDAARRRREFGIRLALGARSRQLARGVLVRGGRLALAGTLLGVGSALALQGVLRGLLYGVAAHDPGTIALAAAGLVATVLAASLAPALRAARIEPAAALRDL